MARTFHHLIDRKTIPDLIREWSEKTPLKPALLTDDNRSLDYRCLVEGMDVMRVALNGVGFARGDRLAIVHASDARLPLIWLGVMSAATAVPLNPALTEVELAREFHNRGVDGLLVAAGTQAEARRAAQQLSLPVLDIVWDGPELDASFHLEGAGKDMPARPGHAGPDDLALVLGSSGTTDRSKVIPLRHRTHFAQVAATHDPLELTGNDRCINLNPLYLMGGIQHLGASLMSGGSVVVVSHFACDRFFHTIEALRPTWFLGSFTFLQPIIDHARANGSAIEPGQFRFLRVSSGRIKREQVDAIEKIFGAPVIEALGTTETGRVACNPLPPGVRKFGTVGPPINCEIAVIDDHMNFLPAGRQGEVVIRGDMIFDGYEGDDAANERAFFEGWYRTGDLGFLDDDNYLTLVGRVKEMINRGGEKISPGEVDDALRAHRDIADAAAFSIPHRSLGEVVGAAIVLTAGARTAKDDIRLFLRDLLSPIKRPNAYVFVDEIPRTPLGKVKRAELTALYESKR